MSAEGQKIQRRKREPAAAQFLLQPRLKGIERVLAQRTRMVTVVLDRLKDSFNIAAVLRTCEALGLQDVHLILNQSTPFKPNTTVTQGSDKWVDIHIHKDSQTCVTALHMRGYKVLASNICATAMSLFDVRFDEKIALVFGNEHQGVAEDMLALADACFWIPMRGFAQSMNVSAAASAGISRAVSWRLEHLGKVGDLNPIEIRQLRKEFQIRSVKQRRRIYYNT